MKLTNLNETLKSIEPLPESLNVQMPSYRIMYRSALGNAVGTDADQSVRLFTLGQRFQGADAQIELSDDETLLLRAAVASNPAKWTAHFHAQVIKSLTELKEVEPK